jgi:hypothetical protein
VHHHASTPERIKPVEPVNGDGSCRVEPGIASPTLVAIGTDISLDGARAGSDDGLMPRPGRLLACPSCACHIKATEAHCPHCGAAVRQADGSVQRTAAALLLGLTTGVAACSAPVYGGPATGGGGGTVNTGGGTGGPGGSGGTAGSGATASTGGTAGMGGTGGTAGMGGAGGMGGTAGMGGAGGMGGGDTSMPPYGLPPMGGSGGTAGAGGQ